MTKRRTICFAVALLMGLLAGCGNKEIANDVITISRYKGLEVKEQDNPEILEENVWDALLAECTVNEYPTEDLANRMEELRTEYGYVAYYKGKTAEELIKEKTGLSAEELAKEQLKKEYAVGLIAEAEELTLDSDEYEQQLKTAAGDMDPTEYEAMFGQEELMKQFQEEQVLEFLIENLK